MLLEGSIDLVRHVGRDETRLGAMDVPGRWAGGFRAWDEHGAYLATGRAATAGRILRVPAADLRRLWTHAVPPRPVPHRGRLPVRAELRVDGPAAGGPRRPRHTGGRARPRAQQPRRRSHAGGRRPRRRVRGDAVLPPTARRGADHRRPVRPARRAASGARPRPPGDPMALADREDALVGLAGRARRDAGLGAGSRPRRRRCRRRLVRTGRRGARRGPAGAGPRVGGEHPVLDRPARRGQGVHPAHLRPRRGGQVLRPARSGVHAADRTSPRGSRAPW